MKTATLFLFIISYFREDVVAIENVPQSCEHDDISIDDQRRLAIVKVNSAVALATIFDSMGEVEDLSVPGSDSSTVPHESSENLEDLTNTFRVIRSGIGVVTQADIMVAVAAKGEIILLTIVTEYLGHHLTYFL